MAITELQAAQQIDRLSGLPFFSSLSEAALNELNVAIAEEARDIDEARLAVSALLSDTGRSGNLETNRVPSPGELRSWVRSQRSDNYDTPQPSNGSFCARCRDGRPPGWIHDRRIVRGNEYEFSGRCKCQPGGWV